MSACSKLKREYSCSACGEHVAVGDALGPLAPVEIDVVDALDALHVHRQPLEAIGQFARDRRAFEARDLLKVGELRHFHAVAPAFPSEPPGAERRALPVVLDEAHVVQIHVDADRRQGIEIELLQVLRRGLEDHLVLVIVLQAVRVLAVAPVLRPARRLDIGGLPGFRPERAQRRRRMEGAGADLHVVRLQDDAALSGPETLQGQDQPLERFGRIEGRVGGGRHKTLRVLSEIAADPSDAGPRGQRRRAALLCRRSAAKAKRSGER